MQTIDAFDKEFSNEEACKQFLMDMRWPGGVACPRCEATERIYALKSKPWHWVCKNKDCGGRNGYRFSVLTRTIFENTKIPLKLWFKVAYLILVSKKGISALQVHRTIFGEDSGSAYHTSWYMVMRWRACMNGDVLPLSGIVEVDETYVGGKDRNRHWNRKSRQVRLAAGPRPFGEAVGYGKVGVIGAIARKGNVIAKVIGNMDAPTKSSFVRHAINEKVTLVATDENPTYDYLGQNIPHEAVNHSRGEYVRGNDRALNPVTHTSENPLAHRASQLGGLFLSRPAAISGFINRLSLPMSAFRSSSLSRSSSARVFSLMGFRSRVVATPEF